MAGTDGGQFPFWSPDSRSVGFLADNQLKRIDLDGGTVQTLANAAGMRGGAWNSDGVNLFNRLTGGPILRVSSAGGEPTPATRLQTPQQVSHRFPQFLPDSHHFLYYVQGSPESRGVYIGSLNGSETKRLLDADAGALYATSGHSPFFRQNTLFAQGFDSKRLELNGSPIPLAEQVTMNTSENIAAVSTSASGVVIYRTGSPVGAQRQLAWFDRSGNELGKIGDPEPTAFPTISISPDGRHVAVTRTVNVNTDIWLWDLARNLSSRFTFNPAQDTYPIWSPDGSRIAFNSNRSGVFDLYQKPTAGAGTEDLILSTPDAKVISDWSLDGRFLLYRSLDPKTGYDLWVLQINGDRKPLPVVRTGFEERDGQFSPDGKWVAYQSNQSGRFEVYVQPFPGPGGQTLISTNGGAQVRWRRDGKELFYIALDGRLMAVPIRFATNDQIVPGSPLPLFSTHVGGAVRGFDRQQYAVSSDGQLFLMNTLIEEGRSSPITVILNWNPAAK